MAPGMCRIRIAAALLASLAMSGCSLILDFDPPGEGPPIDAAVTDERCMAFEPNDELAQATPIGVGDLMAAICGGEVDNYRITLDGVSNVTVSVSFLNRGGAGDIDLRLLNSTGASSIDDSRTSNDVETVQCPGGDLCNSALPAGDYLVQVLPFNAAVMSEYTLSYTTTPATP
jgi:hypothetical protein